MELMQKYHKDNSAISLEDFSRYPSDSNAVNFLTATTSAISVEELLWHKLLRNNVQKEQLNWLVGIATTARIVTYTYILQSGPRTTPTMAKSTPQIKRRGSKKGKKRTPLDARITRIRKMPKYKTPVYIS
ncbi:hypothetical protein BKA64DRAFT_728164 [Cadophora sp. MPI-SDFR-AT-0126]|nr:hypothetical protein BKA64DRAFT_728164 [Leotiomycetes sp. MPI-SDFR-AT-0126]